MFPMTRLEQEVARRLLLLADKAIKKIGVTSYIHNFSKRKDLGYEEFNGNFLDNVVDFIEEDGRQRRCSPVQIDHQKPHEKWFFGTYLIDLIGADGVPLAHSFWIGFNERSGRIEAGCQTCYRYDCCLFEG